MEERPRGRMKSGTNRRMREEPMRTATTYGWTRVSRLRFLSTENCPVAPARETWLTHEYQGDSSSKRPGSSAVLAPPSLEGTTLREP